MSVRAIHLAAIFTLLTGIAASGKANTIDFETQGAGAPSNFNLTLDSPLVIGVATFTGGELLNHEAGSIDPTAIYGTTNFFGGAYTDPLTIVFSTPVSGFSIDVTNEITDTYTVADNRGGSQSLALTQNVTHTFSLAETGITSVTIGSASTTFFDFAIDNVQFTPATTAVPEPSTLLTLGVLGLAAGIQKLARRVKRL